MSPPAHRPRSPAPASTTAATSPSCSQSRRTVWMVLTIECVSELIALGRFRIRKRTPPSARVRISSDSPVTGEQSRSSPQRDCPRVRVYLGNHVREPTQGRHSLDGCSRNTSEHITGEEPTVRESSNPVFRSLPKQQGGYAQFGTGSAAGAQQVYQGYQTEPYVQRGVSRPLTVDDVVTKTGITLGVLVVAAVASYFLVAQNLALAAPLLWGGMIGGLVLVLVAIFGRKQDNPAIVLSYAACEGLVVGTFSFVVANFMVSGVSAGALISQAVVGTLGVFFGMLVVYKTGAIRVTPKFTRFLVAAGFGAVVLMLVNLVVGLFTHSAGPLRDGGPLAIVFSLLMIGLAAFFFLADFDQADQAIRAGAPEKAAWGIALGLTVTLVWLYLEVLRLLSYFSRN